MTGTTTLTIEDLLHFEKFTKDVSIDLHIMNSRKEAVPSEDVIKVFQKVHTYLD